ncbi:MAG: hypothetical protein M3209_00020 [Acidobacteriota bacterium]|nr:hypothetical protein [Acidobacteriota bacterium]
MLFPEFSGASQCMIGSQELIIITVVILVMIAIISLLRTPREKWHAVADWFYDHVLDFLLYILPFLFTISQFLFSEEGQRRLTSEPKNQATVSNVGFWGMWIIGIGFVLTVILHASKQKKFSKLEENLRSSNSELEGLKQDFLDMSEGLVRSLAQKLEFGSRRDCIERITVYGFDRKTEVFIPFGRFSYDPELDKKGKDFYPNDKGCISKAWRKGHHFDNGFPPYEGNEPAYNTQARKYGYTREEVKQMRMHSSLFFGWRVFDTAGENSLAVIIIEATDSNRWTEQELLDFFEKEKRTLRVIMQRLAPRLPSMSNANNEGY